MSKINLLDQETIDKIAAGEVVERPASIVKELVENSVDAGSNAVTVEIKEGGISLIRVTDNGDGIEHDQVRTAFLRHATSKIEHIEDLLTIGSLGFRGEALSSISAVSQMELITKRQGSLTGVRYVIEGGQEKSYEEIGAPEGSTFLVRNIFYNTPARRKFLKSAVTEAGYISDLMEHLALSHPDISFKFINNGQVKLHTSGNHNLKDIIYNVYGREFASNLIAVKVEDETASIDGFIGKPSVSRGNRNYENYFVNGRFVKSPIIARAIEDAYGNHMMQHRYPFTVLNIRIPGDLVDVNVHPTKQEVRFADGPGIYKKIMELLKGAIEEKELIPEASVLSEKELRAQLINEREKEIKKQQEAPEPFEKIRKDLFARHDSPYELKYDYMRRPGQGRNSSDQYQQGQEASSWNARSDGWNNLAGRQHDYVAEDRNLTWGDASADAEIIAGTDAPATITNVPTPRRDDLAPGKDALASSTENQATGANIQSIDANNQAASNITQTASYNNGQRADSTESEAWTVDQPETWTHDQIEARTNTQTEAWTNDKPETWTHDQIEARTNTQTEAWTNAQAEANNSTQTVDSPQGRPVQQELFDDRLLSKQNIQQHKIIGQVFDTFWIVQFRDQMYIIDQHAAHEKVMYERFVAAMEKKQLTSQQISPPIIITMNLQEQELFHKYEHFFTEAGFEIEPFGGKEYAISAVPDNLYGFTDEELFTQMLDSLDDLTGKPDPLFLYEKLATMACKAAVKGNNRMSLQEVNALIGELLELDNPYNCPHGRPTIISISKYELEKKFKRIV